MNKVQPAIQAVVSFLTTYIKELDEDDWGNLKWVFKYLKGMIHLKLKLFANNLHFIHWYANASFAFHHDCKKHTGAMMTLR